MPRPRTKALTLIKAADLLRAAETRLESVHRALAKATKTRDEAEATYLKIVSETLSVRQQPSLSGEEASTNPA